MNDAKPGQLYHSPIFDTIRKYLKQSDSSTHVFLFAPYVKVDVLEGLVEGIQGKIVLVTTWEPKDFQYGSSELKLYPFCKKREISLYVAKNLHLKLYSIGMNDAILSTGNISHKGLLPNGNEELATMVVLASDDRLYLETILNNARLVDDRMYEKLMKWMEDNGVSVPKIVELEDIVPTPSGDDYAISALPMTRTVDDLAAGYVRIESGQDPSDDLETTSCIYHDLANYGIGSGLSREEFIHELSLRFFKHPFVKKIDEFISPDAYFGRIKTWIQDNCTDVPVPSRRELTGNVQVLLEWFVELGKGRYEVDVPGARSQRIRKINQNYNSNFGNV